MKLLRKYAASILKRYYILTNGGFSVGSAYGARFVFDWRHSLDKKVAVELYEHEQICFLNDWIDRINASTFIDIGSHAGLYSVIAMRHHPGLEVHAFEPDRTNLNQLYANLFVNRMQDQIKIHEHGISNTDGTVPFDTSEDTSSRGTRRISKSGNTVIEVRCLDSILDFKDRVIAIKIDVEGHECEVIEGAGRLLTSNRCFLQVESAPDKFDGLRSMLINLGYNHVDTRGDHYFTNIQPTPE